MLDVDRLKTAFLELFLDEVEKHNSNQKYYGYCWCFKFLIASAAAFSTSFCPFSSTGES